MLLIFYTMIIITEYKVPLLYGIWLHLEVIISVSTIIIAIVDNPPRPYYTFVLGCVIVGVAEIFAVFFLQTDCY